MSKIVLARIKLAQPTVHMWRDVVETLRLLGWRPVGGSYGLDWGSVTFQRGGRFLTVARSGDRLELAIPHGHTMREAEQVRREWERALLLAYFVGALRSMGRRVSIRGRTVIGVGRQRIIRITVGDGECEVNFLLYPGDECEMDDAQLRVALAERGLVLQPMAEVKKYAGRRAERRVGAWRSG
ncbi:MAG: hypothetical protein DRJ67_03690 [Thermoprotei archaeon]|nr:MAG: hypothetical protein DRJ67_03690 [Thermoprotei archaeon]